jgi:hypothetical protein
VLREALEQVGQRFVMIIDGELRQRKTFSYDTLSGLPSPLEFLGWAEALRTKQVATLQARQAREAFARVVHVQPFFAVHRHKHRVPGVACTPRVHARAV